MARTIDQIRASKLPSNMMQFAARGAMQVPPAENIEILVYLALPNKVFGELARMTLAGWDEKACRVAASDPTTNREVLDYLISPDNLRPRLLPALLENQSVSEAQVLKVARAAMRDIIEIVLKSKRAMSFPGVVDGLRSNPYLKKEEAEQLQNLATETAAALAIPPAEVAPAEPPTGSFAAHEPASPAADVHSGPDPSAPTTAEGDEVVSAYMKDRAGDRSRG